MTPYWRRILLDFLIYLAFFALMRPAWWQIPIIAAYSIWNYYDGYTRKHLSGY